MVRHDGTKHLYVMQGKHTKEKEVIWSSNYTAHVDNMVLLNVFRWYAPKLKKQEELNKPINLSKMKQNNLFSTKYGTISVYFWARKLKRLFLLMKIMEKQKMHTKVNLEACNTKNICFWYLFSIMHKKVICSKIGTSPTNLKASDKLVWSLKEK